MARQEGRKKQKSIKAKVTSQTSAKRVLSRHGKKVGKGLMGPGTDFVTRSAALKRLQISLKDFRRLCILKGIFPRVPPKAPKGSDKVYYDIKDLSYLSHEPLLKKFRDFKSFMKKVRKAAGRKEFSEARRRDELKPIMNLDHLVKERYPRFIDALRDMDDAMCMVSLFAAMPSEGRVTASKTLACAELCRHWLYYVAKTKCLNKVFVSVKGFYYQAEVMGEKITWLVPHQFTQTVPREVDLRIMTTFVDFYEVFVRFALFKLYHMAGLRYPPVVDKSLLDSGCCLLSIKAVALDGGASSADAAAPSSSASSAVVVATTSAKHTSTETGKGAKDKGAKGKGATDKAALAKISSLQDRLAEFGDLDEDDDDEDAVPIFAPLAAAFSGLHEEDDGEGEEDSRKTFAVTEDEKDRKARLFSKLRFFISREVPLEWLQVCILSFGGQVGWEGESSPFGAEDAGVTHLIVDRPAQGAAPAGRESVQPQWVFDCVNTQMLLPTLKYRPGASLPPHLSPFVDDDKEGYLPKYRQELLSLAGEGATGKGKGKAADKEKLDEEEDEDVEGGKYAQEVRAEKKGAASDAASSSSSSKAAAAAKGKDKGKDKSKGKGKRGREEEPEEDEDEEGDSDDEDDDDDEDEEEEEPRVVKGPKGVVHKPAEQALSEVRTHPLTPSFPLPPSLPLSLSLLLSQFQFILSWQQNAPSIPRDRECQLPPGTPPSPQGGGGAVAVVVDSSRYKNCRPSPLGGWLAGRGDVVSPAFVARRQ
jgi:pescadillo protein